MKRMILQTLVTAGFLLFNSAASAQTLNQAANRQVDNPFYSPDQYRLAHSMFDTIRTDLYRAQTDAYPNYFGNSPRFNIAHNDLRTLEQNWNNGHYDSREIADTISSVEMVLKDNRIMPHDRDVLGRDLSRLIDFQSEYY